MNEKQIKKTELVKKADGLNAVQKLAQTVNASVNKSVPVDAQKKTELVKKALPEDVNAGFVYVNDSVFFSQYSVG